MADIIFHAVYKGKRKRFDISQVSGSSGMYHLYIDRRYYGQFSVRKGVWVFLPQNPDDFTPDQMQKLVDKLTEHYS